MDFRHLQQFVVLAETLNFRRAAERLHMSQPPLSVSIRKLESELGVDLFVRGKDGVRLTPSGEAALADARRALFHANQFNEAARAASTGDGGVLRVGFVGSATHYILPRIVTAFRSRHPGVQLVLREATSVRIMQGLEDDTLDVGVVRVPVSSHAGTRLLPLQTEPFILAVPSAHPLAKVNPVRLQDLSEEGFILYTQSDAAGLRMASIHACQLRGFTPRLAQEAVQVQTVLSLVEAGLGIALVPSINRRLNSEKITYKALADFPESASIGISLTWRPDVETPALRNFLQVASQLFDLQ
ncbi:LysR family transcriptional regulator [Allopusillimonas soli]|uniref:LysR family transcriptional regulator n=1 Tax=Allopusillimonas soli TaxID=659016 RepID=A0A853F643_9BURK|nr:LysR family transcriptional regulator [Allopusillimonas soli]NYT36024.1 LysR family transcriptional regulator [Allopusillimonas soli]TEA76367.1 LysR family transcriptional regulator [Allopusillimonas soli]